MKLRHCSCRRETDAARLVVCLRWKAVLNQATQMPETSILRNKYRLTVVGKPFTAKLIKFEP